MSLFERDQATPPSNAPTNTPPRIPTNASTPSSPLILKATPLFPVGDVDGLVLEELEDDPEEDCTEDDEEEAVLLS